MQTHTKNYKNRHRTPREPTKNIQKPDKEHIKTCENPTKADNILQKKAKHIQKTLQEDSTTCKKQQKHRKHRTILCKTVHKHTKPIQKHTSIYSNYETQTQNTPEANKKLLKLDKEDMETCKKQTKEAKTNQKQANNSYNYNFGWMGPGKVPTGMARNLLLNQSVLRRQPTLGLN